MMTDVRSLRARLVTRTAPAVLLAFATAMTGCSRADPAGAGTGGGREGGGRAGGAAPVMVTTATAVEKPMAVNVRAVGNVEPSSYVDVRSQVNGQLLSVEFQEGQDVQAGQLLFTIDARPFEVALQQAQAQLARDTAQLEGARLQLRRSNDLLKRGLVAQSENDATSTQVASLQALVASDTAQVENAKLQLQYTKILAPVAGRTGALLVHRGSLVRSADTTPLVVINTIAPAFVSFAVPARLVPQIREELARGRLTVRATPTGNSDAPETGTVSFVDNAVDQATDTIRLKATFPNANRRLWPGAFADVILQLSVEPHAIVIPDAAVQASQQGNFVYVMKADHTVEVRPVTIAWTDAGESVVQNGVRPGEVVVTDGQLRLTPGAHVTVKSPTGAAPAGAQS
jgi:multidrug efflux system membrane fusion protein